MQRNKIIIIAIIVTDLSLLRSFIAGAEKSWMDESHTASSMTLAHKLTGNFFVFPEYLLKSPVKLFAGVVCPQTIH